MITVVLQILLGALALTFGVVALLVSRRTHAADKSRREGWLLTGFIFALSGATYFGQSLWAGWAVLAGPGTAVYTSYMQWAAVANHGRQFLLLAFACGLFAILLKKLIPRFDLWRVVIGAAIGIVGVGLILGWVEGEMDPAVHDYRLTLSTTALLLLLVGGLLGTLLTNSLDRLLWLALLTYTIRQGLDVPWLAAFASSRIEGAWQPSYRAMLLLGIASYIAMIGLAVYRLILARRGERVPALFEQAPRKEFSTFA